MLNIHLVLFMIGISNYLNYAKEHDRRLVHYDGIVIYAPEFGPLPQDVMFLPQAWNKKGDFEEFMVTALSKEDSKLYQVYFQGIRWIMPDIVEVLKSTKSVKIKVGSKNTVCKATYATLTFDETPDLEKDPEVTIGTTPTKMLPLMINSNKLIVRLQDIPEEMGTLKLYQPIVW
ncbi:hypothetical protein [Pedobacter kyungheensis]|nr:hypothetical protein [Pedobacter kyungheensis]